jgi:hypothetical protein
MPSVILELALRVATESGTPVAVVDEAVMDANLRRMAEFAVAGGVRLSRAASWPLAPRGSPWPR